MIKRALITIALVGAFFLTQHGVRAQATDNGLLKGFYAFNTTGQAQLSNTGDCKAQGLVAAALTDGFLNFDGNGSIVQGQVGISIGATSCGSINYGAVGTYTVTAKDEDTFTASGTLTLSFQGRLAPCAGTSLKAVPFNLIGKIADNSFIIQTTGAGEGSSYAEGPPPGPLSCQSPILNFITSGTGTKNPIGVRP